MIAKLLIISFVVSTFGTRVTMRDIIDWKSKLNLWGNVLTKEGVFVIGDAIEKHLLVDIALHLSECMDSGVKDVHVSQLLDGSFRTTFARSGNSEFDVCGESLENLMNEYDKVVSKVGLDVGKLIGGAVDEDEEKLVNIVTSPDSGSLDHYHVYSSQGGRDVIAPNDAQPIVSSDLPVKEDVSVAMHYDMGLFLILAPGIWLDSRDNKLVNPEYMSQLVVENLLGKRYSIPADIDSNKLPLIVVIGKGVSDYMYPDRIPRIRAGLHAVEGFPKGDTELLRRVMLGRMFMPRMDFVKEGSTQSFGEFFYGPLVHGKPLRNEPQHSSSLTQWRRLIENRCEAGTKYCWMDCQEDVNCPGSQTSVCMNSKTNEICPEDACDEDCALMCPAEDMAGLLLQSDVPTSRQSPPVLFCRGATSMVMTGFESITSPKSHCIILLFRGWLLNTPLKFAFGCLGMFLLGILIEGTIKLRRYVSDIHKSTYHNRSIWQALVVLLFAINVSLGYFGMLAAMTFNVEIFVSTVAGLATGHVIFGNSGAPVRESADPCCVTSESFPQHDVETTLKNSTGACCCDIR